MAFKVNGLDVINDSSEVAQMVATAAEAQAGAINNKVMTPQRTKELIQGGTVSVIKSIQRFSVHMGTYTAGSVDYFTWGASSSSTGFSFDVPSGSMGIYTPGAAASYCFVTLAQAVNRRKAFVISQYSGDPRMSSAKVRLYTDSGGGAYSGGSVQITTADVIQHSLYPRIAGGAPPANLAPSISVEIVEFY